MTIISPGLTYIKKMFIKKTKFSRTRNRVIPIFQRSSLFLKVHFFYLTKKLFCTYNIDCTLCIGTIFYFLDFFSLLQLYPFFFLLDSNILILCHSFFNFRRRFPFFFTLRRWFSFFIIFLITGRFFRD